MQMTDQVLISQMGSGLSVRKPGEPAGGNAENIGRTPGPQCMHSGRAREAALLNGNSMQEKRDRIEACFQRQQCQLGCSAKKHGLTADEARKILQTASPTAEGPRNSREKGHKHGVRRKADSR
jgi:hypothetical protein